MSAVELGKRIRKVIKKKYCKILQTYVTFYIPEEIRYSLVETLQLFATAGIRNDYVNAVANGLRAVGHKCQTGETAFERIRYANPNQLLKEMREANDEIIKTAVERNELKNEIIVSIDSHNVYRYTKIPISDKRKRECTDIKTVVGRKPKNGACYAHEYITIQNIKMEDNPTYVLAFERILPLQNITDIARNLLIEAESKTGLKIKLVIADGDFDNIDTMKMFMEERKHFIVRADQDKKVKGIIEKVEKKENKYHIEYGYIKGNKNNFTKVNLIVINVEWLKKQGIKYPLKKKEYITFFTDLYPDEDETMEHFCLKIAVFYKKRWGIETGYRDISDFEAKTHSLSDAVRLFLYLQAILLYNFWIQINMEFKDDPDRIRHFKNGIPKSILKFLMEEVIREAIEKLANKKGT